MVNVPPCQHVRVKEAHPVVFFRPYEAAHLKINAFSTQIAPLFGESKATV